MTQTRRTYVVECYSPGIDGKAVRAAGDRATASAVELHDHGRPVDYLGALLVPVDEVVFYRFAASSLAAVPEASLRAGVDFERVLESVPVGIDGLSVTPVDQSMRGDDCNGRPPAKASRERSGPR